MALTRVVDDPEAICVRVRVIVPPPTPEATPVALREAAVPNVPIPVPVPTPEPDIYDIPVIVASPTPLPVPVALIDETLFTETEPLPVPVPYALRDKASSNFGEITVVVIVVGAIVAVKEVSVTASTPKVEVVAVLATIVSMVDGSITEDDSLLGSILNVTVPGRASGEIAEISELVRVAAVTRSESTRFVLIALVVVVATLTDGVVTPGVDVALIALLELVAVVGATASEADVVILRDETVADVTGVVIVTA